MNVREIYHDSDGAATTALYAELARLGAVGDVAVNLLRAQKASARAKVYHGGLRGRGSYRAMAYGRKEWSLGNLCTILHQHASRLSLAYGWQRPGVRAEWDDAPAAECRS